MDDEKFDKWMVNSGNNIVSDFYKEVLRIGWGACEMAHKDAINGLKERNMLLSSVINNVV